MAPTAVYDAWADWYEGYVTGAAAPFTRRVGAVLVDLLGRGAGSCLDVCCGTGVYAPVLRGLGWSPVGVDLSVGQLRHARARLPVAAGDAAGLPLSGGSVAAAVCPLAHTDVADYAAVLREVAWVLRPGGRFVHVGVHPGFAGAFADRGDAARVVVDAGYGRRERRLDGWTPDGVRARVGAAHVPLADLLTALARAGLRLERAVESGPAAGVPDMLGLAATKDHRPPSTDPPGPRPTPPIKDRPADQGVKHPDR